MSRIAVIISLLAAFTVMVSAWPLAWTPLASLLKDFTVSPNQTPPQLNGTIWRGEMKGVEPFGSIQYKLRPLNVYKGDPPVSFSSLSRAISSKGFAHMSGVKDVIASGDLAWILPKDRRFGGIQGGFDLSLKDLGFDLNAIETGCVSADGIFKTDVLRRNQKIWYWQGPELSGPIRCEAGDLVTDLSGAEDGQNIQVKVKMQADGIYSADIQVQTNTQGAEAVLTLYGFSKSGRKYSLIETGKWR